MEVVEKNWFLIDDKLLGAKTYHASPAEPALVQSSVNSFSGVEFSTYLLVVLLVAVGLHKIYKLYRSKAAGSSSAWKVGGILAGVSLIYASYVLFLLWDVPFNEIAPAVREGVFGDSFGTLNALFSGLAFSGVLITLLLQKKDLSETREQVARQQIESQFYSMLELQQEVVRNFDLQEGSNKSVISSGRDCFKIWVAGVRHYYEKFAVEQDLQLAQSQYPASLRHEDVVIHAYETLFEKHRSDLGVYFRSLYSVFRFVEGSKHVDSNQFALVIRSLLSDNELVLLFYNCLSLRGEKFKKYVYRYALFDNLEKTLLIKPSDVNMLTFEAYGSNREILESLTNAPGNKML